MKGPKHDRLQITKPSPALAKALAALLRGDKLTPEQMRVLGASADDKWLRGHIGGRYQRKRGRQREWRSKHQRFRFMLALGEIEERMESGENFEVALQAASDHWKLGKEALRSFAVSGQYREREKRLVGAIECFNKKIAEGENREAALRDAAKFWNIRTSELRTLSKSGQ